MIDFIIPILSAYFDSGLDEYYFYIIIALAFVACVPGLCRYILQWR